VSDRDAFRDDVLHRQHDAELALVSGDVGPRLAMWSHVDPVCLFAAVGPSKKGWEELEPTFRAVAARLSEGRDVSFELMEFDVGEDVAWTAGFVRFVVSIDGEPASARTLRITHVYRREDGEWKVVHEHSNWEPAGS
jgi:ketosteroid isomerase-like protein